MMHANNDNSPSKKTKIFHYTAPMNVDEIISSGFIELELHRHYEELKTAANDNIRGAKRFLDSFRWTGRYVWFTEAPSSQTAAAYSTVRFTFFAEDIGAERWETVKRRQIRKMGGRAFEEISCLERTAVKLGDNPENWWVCHDRVPVTAGHFDARYKLPDPPYSYEECKTFSEVIENWRLEEMLRRLNLKPIGAFSR